jgi:hypothetical protein
MEIIYENFENKDLILNSSLLFFNEVDKNGNLIKDNINNLIVMQIISDNKKNKLNDLGIKKITKYYICPNIFEVLDKYSNQEIENEFIGKLAFGNNTLLYKIIQITCQTNNFIYLDYLKNRGIDLTFPRLKYTISMCINYIINNMKSIDNFHVIKYLIEYGICISSTEILYDYVYYIHSLLFEDDFLEYKFQIKFESNKITYINNMIYLINKNVDLNHTRDISITVLPKIKSINDMLIDLDIIKDIHWYPRKDYIMLIEGTELYIHKNNETNQHINKYISNDLLMKEILSFI